MGQNSRAPSECVVSTRQYPAEYINIIENVFIVYCIGLVCGHHAVLFLIGRVLWQYHHVRVIQQIQS